MTNTARQQLTFGDAVQHRSNPNLAGVVLRRHSRTQVVVSLENGTEAVWYTANCRVV